MTVVTYDKYYKFLRNHCLTISDTFLFRIELIFVEFIIDFEYFIKLSNIFSYVSTTYYKYN